MSPTHRASKPWTVEEFLDWATYQEERYELVDGQPQRTDLDPDHGGDPTRMMTRPTPNHQRIVLNLGRRLLEAMDGHRCEPIAELGVRTKIDALRIPDLTIDCDPPKGSGNAEAGNPRVVFEVLSPTTRERDLRAKLPEFKRLRTLAHIVFVDPVDLSVTCWSRNGERDDWASERLEGENVVIDLPAVGVTLPLKQVFERVRPGGSAASGEWPEG